VGWNVLCSDGRLKTSLPQYSVGTWTPIIGGATSQSGQVYSGQDGQYIKVGRMVTIWFNATLTTLGTVTGDIRIKGLPFTTDNVGCGPIAWNGLGASFVFIQSLWVGSQTSLIVNGIKVASAALTLAPVVPADLANTAQFVGMATYRTAA
jgi:hypothetical protein